jgi:hypothetical protein
MRTSEHPTGQTLETTVTDCHEQLKFVVNETRSEQ